MKKVYMLTEGCYSDYTVVGIFSSKENAELFAKAYGSSELNPICEVKLDACIDKLKAGMRKFTIEMSNDGTVKYAHKQDYIYQEEDSYRCLYKNTSFFRANVWARDKDHAIKITNERRIEAIASGKLKGPDTK